MKEEKNITHSTSSPRPAVRCSEELSGSRRELGTKAGQAAESSFGNLLKQFFSNLPKVGDLVKGKVISMDNGSVRLDIDGVITGVVRGQELFAESNEYSNLKIGTEVEATIVEEENENGEMELSFRAAGHRLVWNRMAKYRDDGLTIKGKVLSANKGGLMIQVDALQGFMPVSQLNPDHYPRVPGGDKNRILEHLRQIVGKDLLVKVIDIDENDNKLIVSEKEVWEDEQKAVLDSYQIGDIVEGEVSALTSFGAFVKFGDGLEGLVHISEIVWQRIDHPKDVLKVGDRVKAQIIDLNKSKIYLSIKRMIEDPWKTVKEKFKIGEKVDGLVHKVEPFGLMIKLDDDIHGLAHITELSDDPSFDPKLVKEKFTIGSKHEFEIISIEPNEHRLGLKLAGVKGKKTEDPSSTAQGKEKKSEPAIKEESAKEENPSVKTQDKEEVKKEKKVKKEKSEEKVEEKKEE